MSNIQEPVEIEGHLIDSGILKYAFDKIVEHGGQFEVLDFRIGQEQSGNVQGSLDGESDQPGATGKDPGRAGRLWRRGRLGRLPVRGCFPGQHPA